MPTEIARQRTLKFFTVHHAPNDTLQLATTKPVQIEVPTTPDHPPLAVGWLVVRRRLTQLRDLRSVGRAHCLGHVLPMEERPGRMEGLLYPDQPDLLLVALQMQVMQKRG